MSVSAVWRLMTRCIQTEPKGTAEDPTFWSTNRWGQPGKTSQGAMAGKTENEVKR